MSVLMLTEAELRTCVGNDGAALEAVAQAFAWYAEGRAEMPPVMHIEVRDHNGDVDVKSAYVRGLDAMAVKIASGFLDNAALGFATGSAMMVLLSAKTGRPEAVLLDNGYLTDLRTGLAGAVAARHMAPESVSTVGVIGCGAQARYQIHALTLVRSFERLQVFARNAAATERYCDEMRDALGVPVNAVTSASELVRSSDLVVTTTPSREGLVELQDLHPKLHITAMGSDLAGKRELGAGVLHAAHTYVCDARAQVQTMGELQHAEGTDSPAAVTELGDVVAGRARGRRSEDDVTICDLTGMGVQDTAIAVAALDAAKARGLGVRIG
jgi:ornithine cyclodeaminase